MGGEFGGVVIGELGFLVVCSGIVWVVHRVNLMGELYQQEYGERGKRGKRGHTRARTSSR